MDPADRQWRRRAVEGQRLRSDSRSRTKRRRLEIETMADRVYHASKTLETHYDKPTHGNLRDPLLEAIFLMLCWRTPIPVAQALLARILGTFKGPQEFVESRSLPRLAAIVRPGGFGKKRPLLLQSLVRSFIARFPDGNYDQLRRWSDGRIESFLGQNSGIGPKTISCFLSYSLGRQRFAVDSNVARVLRRSQLLSPVAHVKPRTTQKELQGYAEALVPPSSRGSLHAGLVALGKDVCTARNPDCARCPIRNLCKTFRTKVARSASRRKLTHVDLFAGAGGFSVGFGEAGFRTVLAVDSDPDAVATFRLNNPQVPEANILERRIKNRRSELRAIRRLHHDLMHGTHISVITAGVPCQGFSKAGYRSRPAKAYSVMGDPRNHMFRAVVLWTRVLKPDYVIIENVPDMRSARGKNGSVMKSLVGSFEAMRYAVELKSVNAVEFGVPQIRRRLIVIATRRVRPKSVFDALEMRKSAGQTVESALAGLPRIRANSGQWYVRTAGGVVTSHVSRYLNEQDALIYRALRPGEPYWRFISRRRDLIGLRRKRGEFAVYGTSSFADKYHKLRPGQPSRTIVAHLQRDGNGYIHPGQTRSISIREAVRLQGFRDSWVVCGSRGSQFIQVGNAVPPPLAKAIGLSLRAHSRGRRSN